MAKTIKHKYNLLDEVYYPCDNAPFTVIGVTLDQIQIEGDFSGGTNTAIQSCWVNPEDIKPFDHSKNDYCINGILRSKIIKSGDLLQATCDYKINNILIEKGKTYKVVIANMYDIKENTFSFAIEDNNKRMFNFSYDFLKKDSPAHAFDIIENIPHTQVKANMYVRCTCHTGFLLKISKGTLYKVLEATADYFTIENDNGTILKTSNKFPKHEFDIPYPYSEGFIRFSDELPAKNKNIIVLEPEYEKEICLKRNYCYITNYYPLSFASELSGGELLINPIYWKYDI